MSGGTLPRTGAGLALGTIGGVTIGLPELGVTFLVVGISIVVLSALTVRVIFRRRKGLGQA